MVLFECGSYKLNNDFDSGNLGRAEFVKNYTDDIFNPSLDPLTCDPNQHLPTYNAEINVWTRPDCAGTPYENGNRTWFYFSVKGGQASHILRLNVMNLNRQAKLYSQGMHPVVKIGASGKWERAKDIPSYRIDNENFVMSFVHRAGEDPSVEHFYAFTFPYTYRELQEYLTRLDRRFRKRMFEVQKRSQEEGICLYVDQKDFKGMPGKSSTSPPSSASSASSTATATDRSDSLSALRRESLGDSSDNCFSELTTAEDFYNEIYYCRELLTYSVEKRRIDLLTITSYHGISAEREARLTGLFPETVWHRCHAFKNKKIIFLSSRVHPGETPASFVLNGFIRLLLDRKSQIAATLRRMYVFKIVPFLNPDGVCNGLYRSDTLGHNLNRVYTSPDPKTQPSIYAVRRLLSYYQHGIETTPVAGEEGQLPKVKSPDDLPALTPELEKLSEEEKEISTDRVHTVASLKELLMNKINRERTPPSDDQLLLPPTSPSQVEINCAGPENDENCTPLITLTSLDCGGESSSSLDNSKSEPSARIPLKVTTAASRIGRKIGTEKRSKSTERSTATKGKQTPTAKKEFKRKASPKATVMSARYKTQDMLKDNEAAAVESMIGNLCGNQTDFHNLYSHFESELDKDKVEDKTNLFLYIDLHGHASKKGVFMYGNHMAHPMQAVECLLLPRLMSMNSHHFHYDACNFSERNMYHKGKRDGLSKEGSGRVAIYKSTGVIKCYTLECNYNTGKYVNVLPARGKDKAPKAVNLVPPKYTPAIFEEVGRALGASILDLTNSNPISRLLNSEFRTLQGLRNALRSDIEKTFTKNQLLLKAAKGKLKRLKSVLSFSKDGSGSASLSTTTTGNENQDQAVLREGNRSHWAAAAAVSSSSSSLPVNRSIGLRNVTNRTITAAVPVRGLGGAGGGGSVKYINTPSSSGSGTIYGKKERATRKKDKTSKAPNFVLKKENPVPLLNLVPVKRLKGALSSSTSGASDDISAIPSTSCSSDEGRTPTATACSSQSDEASCSTSTLIPTKVIVKQRASGIPVFKRPAAIVTIAPTVAGCSSVSYTTPGTSKIGGGVGAQNTTKISTVGGGKGKKDVGSGGMGTLGSGGSGGPAVGVKLKTKRSLKSDALTVKRKKSRAKSVWH